MHAFKTTLFLTLQNNLENHGVLHHHKDGHKLFKTSFIDHT